MITRAVRHPRGATRAGAAGGRAWYGVVIGLLIALLATSACGDDVSLDSAAEHAGAVLDQAGAQAGKLTGPAKAASDALADGLAGARNQLPAAARGLADNARCVSDGAVTVLGDRLVERYRAAGITDSAELTTTQARALRASLDRCVSVQPVLVGALAGAGLSNAKATCVAERALSDDKAMAGIVLGMIFGDPGLTTVVTVAVRAGAACLSPADLQRLLPDG